MYFEDHEDQGIIGIHEFRRNVAILYVVAV